MPTDPKFSIGDHVVSDYGDEGVVVDVEDNVVWVEIGSIWEIRFWEDQLSLVPQEEP